MTEFTSKEVEVMHTMIDAFARKMGEDIIGAILKTGGGTLINDEEVVRLVKKLDGRHKDADPLPLNWVNY